MTALASRVIAAATARSRSIAVAESLTGGLVLAALVDVPGASLVLRGGVVAYDTALKHSLLGVDAELLAARGAVDPAVAIGMAEGARLAAAVGGAPADVAVSTTGVAGPEPQDGRPVGLVFIGVASERGSSARELRLRGARASIRAQAATAALEALLEAIEAG